MKPRTLSLVLVTLGVAFALSACAVRDLNRGMQPRARKEYEALATVFSNAYPELKQEDILTSFKKLKYSEFVYGPFSNYSDWANYLAFDDIADSISRFGENPYAWALLSDYLQLERQPNAAIVACNRALESIKRLEMRSANGLDERVSALDISVRLNRSMYSNLIGRYVDARDEALRIYENTSLNQHGETPLQVAAVFVVASARIGLNDLEGASAILDEGETRFEGKLTHSALFDDDDWAQYFDADRRHTLFDYLRAEVLLRQDRAPLAEVKLRNVINKNKEFLAARLSLASAYYAQRKYRTAEDVLVKLMQDSASSRLYTYFLALFNLGNVYAVTGRGQLAATQFEQLINSAESQDKQFFAKIVPHIPSEIIPSIRRSAEQPIVLEAFNNLGTALLQDDDVDIADRKSRANRAIKYFNKAKKLHPEMALTNIAIAQQYAGDSAAAVDTLRAELAQYPDDAVARSRLISYGIASQDKGVAFDAIEAWIQTGKTGNASRGDLVLLRSIQTNADWLVTPANAQRLKSEIDDALTLAEQ
jgi:hypothetical protein